MFLVLQKLLLEALFLPFETKAVLVSACPHGLFQFRATKQHIVYLPDQSWRVEAFHMVAEFAQAVILQEHVVLCA